MSYAAQHARRAQQPRFDPNDWASKKKAAVERAKQLRNERNSGIVDEQCTFVPKTTAYVRQPIPKDSLDELSLQGRGQQRLSARRADPHQRGSPGMDARPQQYPARGQNAERFDLNPQPFPSQPFPTQDYQQPPHQEPFQSQQPFQGRQASYDDRQQRFGGQPPAEQRFQSSPQRYPPQEPGQFSMPFGQRDHPNNDRYQGFPNADINDPLNQKQTHEYRQFFQPGEIESLGNLASGYDLPSDNTQDEIDGLPPRESRSRMTRSRIASLGRSKSAADRRASGGRRRSGDGGDRRAKSAAAHHHDGDAYWGTDQLSDESGQNNYSVQDRSMHSPIDQAPVQPVAPYQNSALQTSPLANKTSPRSISFKGTRRSRPSQYRQPQPQPQQASHPEWGDMGNNENKMGRNNLGSMASPNGQNDHPNGTGYQNANGRDGQPAAAKVARPGRRRDRRQNGEQALGGSVDSNTHSFRGTGRQQGQKQGQEQEPSAGVQPSHSLGSHPNPGNFGGFDASGNGSAGDLCPPAPTTFDANGGGGMGMRSSSPKLNEVAVAGADGNPPEYAPPVQLFPCSLCGRKFNEKALAKHAKVCDKGKAKRKKFDTKQTRVAGTEAAKFVKEAEKAERRGGNPKEKEIKEKKKESWKKKSSALRDAMKANRQVQKAIKEGKDLSTIPTVASTPDPDFVPCPHCGRTFNATAAERHIPKCNDIKAKPKSLKRGAGGGMGSRNAINSRTASRRMSGDSGTSRGTRRR